MPSPLEFQTHGHGGSPRRKVQFTVAASCWATEVLTAVNRCHLQRVLVPRFDAQRHQGREPKRVTDGEAKTHEELLWSGFLAVQLRGPRMLQFGNDF
jgi:hypothetical protein